MSEIVPSRAERKALTLPLPGSYAWERLENQLASYDGPAKHDTATTEALKHPPYLYFARAGAYADAPRKVALLAERVDALASQEHHAWSSTQADVRAVGTS